MKKVLIAIFVFTLFFVSSACADGLYVGGNLGITMLEDAEVEGLTVESDTGYSLSGFVGYSKNKGRIEMETSYQTNDLDKLGVEGYGEVGIDGDVSSISMLFNGYIDFTNSSSVTPYIGAGLGIARVEISKVDVPGYGDLTTKSVDDTVFAYQIGTGLLFKINDNIALDFKYRYLGTEDPEYEGVKIPYGSHDISLGMRYIF